MAEIDALDELGPDDLVTFTNPKTGETSELPKKALSEDFLKKFAKQPSKPDEIDWSKVKTASPDGPTGVSKWLGLAKEGLTGQRSPVDAAYAIGKDFLPNAKGAAGAAAGWAAEAPGKVAREIAPQAMAENFGPPTVPAPGPENVPPPVPAEPPTPPPGAPPPTAFRGLQAPAKPGGGAPGQTAPASNPWLDELHNQSKAMEAVAQQQSAAAAATAQAAQDKGAAERAVFDETLKTNLAKEEQTARIQNEYKASRDAQIQKYTSALEQLAKGPNPDHWWSTKTTGQKVLAGIGMALGVFGGAQTGVNSGVDAIRKSIDSDIQRQQKALEVGVEGASNLLGMMRQHYSDDIAAVSATKAAAWELADKKLNFLSRNATDQQTQAKLMETKAAIQAEKQKNEQDLLSRIHEMSIREAQLSLERQRVGLEQQRLGLAMAKAGKAGPTMGSDALADFAKAWRGGGGMTGWATQGVPGTKAEDVRAQRDPTALAIATQLNGGKAPRPALIDWVKDRLPAPGGRQKLGELQIKYLEKQLGSSRPNVPSFEPDTADEGEE